MNSHLALESPLSLSRSDALKIAKDILLAPAGITEGDLQKTLSHMHLHRLDDADLYLQRTLNESWSLEEGIVKSGSFGIDQGVGVRAISQDKTAFAYSDEISISALKHAAEATRVIGPKNQKVHIPPQWATPPTHALYQSYDPLASLDAKAKIALLENIERKAKAKDPRIVQVMAGLAGEFDVILVARANGVLAADIRPLVRVSITVIAEQHGRREVGSSGGYSD